MIAKLGAVLQDGRLQNHADDELDQVEARIAALAGKPKNTCWLTGRCTEHHHPLVTLVGADRPHHQYRTRSRELSFLYCSEFHRSSRTGDLGRLATHIR